MDARVGVEVHMQLVGVGAHEPQELATAHLCSECTIPLAFGACMTVCDVLGLLPARWSCPV